MSPGVVLIEACIYNATQESIINESVNATGHYKVIIKNALIFPDGEPLLGDGATRQEDTCRCGV